MGSGLGLTPGSPDGSGGVPDPRPDGSSMTNAWKLPLNDAETTSKAIGFFEISA